MVSLIICFFVCLLSRLCLKEDTSTKNSKFFREKRNNGHLDEKYGILTSQHSVNIQEDIESFVHNFDL
jgi:hypothetical protein